MKRQQFLTTLGVSAATVLFVPYLVSCSKSNSIDSGTGPGPGSGTGGAVDFTLDLSLSANSALNTNGNSIINSGIIIARTSSATFLAVAAVCTHEGSQIQFDSANNRFKCSNTGAGHGSIFTGSGSVISGPAPTALRTYNTQLSGTMLRIYA